jgi:hypothetical protein
MFAASGVDVALQPVMSSRSVRQLFGLCCLSSLLACTSTPSVPLGSVQVASYTFDVAREGDAPGAGVTTRFVLKPTAGGNPTSITGWVGTASGDGSTKAVAVYDAGDGDFDDDVTMPSPMPTGAKFYFDVNTSGTIATGSVELK